MVKRLDMHDHRLLVVLITYNRLAYTKKTLRTFWDTISTPYYLVVVDNASTDGTPEYLRRVKKRGRIDKLILNKMNFYPGAATNIGWREGLEEYPIATHLMRLDNDMHLEKGWDTAALDYFKKIPSMGQIGIEHAAIENERAAAFNITLNSKTFNKFPGNVGGPNIISRLVWDKGLRYNEEKWDSFGTGKPTPQEDVAFSRAILNAGFLMGHMTEKLAWTFANQENWKDYPDYYKKTMSERGYDHLLKEVFGDE